MPRSASTSQAGRERNTFAGERIARPESRSMSFALYLIGLAVLLSGIAWGLISAGLAVTYVVIACLIVAGLGIMMAVSRTRAKDPPA
jgi:hypothetical protein